MSFSFQNISYTYGSSQVLSALDLEIEKGQITCLLGVSGSGKSTLLHLAAGLKPLQEGRIEIDGKLLASAEYSPPPEKRPVGLVFQENALFPNMTVAQNIGFGLNGKDKQEITTRIESLLDMVGLSDLGQRYPHQLSGGQQQRVTLARSLAPDPQVLLMDEPYANIDVTRRRALREAARSALRRSGTTTVLVTHDPEEALEMGDKIAIMDHGKIVQLDTPQQIYQQPRTALVAKLFGGAQTVRARINSDVFHTDYGPISSCASAEAMDKQHCELVFRPEGMQVVKDSAANLIVTDLRFLGDAWLALLLPDDADSSLTPLRAQVRIPLEFSVGDRVSLNSKPEGFFCFDINNE